MLESFREYGCAPTHSVPVACLHTGQTLIYDVGEVAAAC